MLSKFCQRLQQFLGLRGPSTSSSSAKLPGSAESRKSAVEKQKSSAERNGSMQDQRSVRDRSPFKNRTKREGNGRMFGTKESLYWYAMQFVGLQYKWGGDDSILGYDCSGFVQELLMAVGMDPPGDQTSQALYNFFHVNGATEAWQFGALAFYGRGLDRITHVGFLINNQILIEAAGGDSRTRTEQDAARDNAQIRIRPVKYRSDLRAVLMPEYDWS